MSNFLATFTIFITIVTAYVITAFVAGKRLSNYQIIIINTCFLASSALIGFLSIITFTRARSLVQSDPDTISTYVPVLSMTWLIVPLYLGLLIGCLAFMHNVRNRDSAEDT